MQRPRKKTMRHGLPTCWIRILLAVLMAIVSATAWADDTGDRPDKLPIGAKVPLMTFKDIRYLPRSLADLANPTDPAPKRIFVLCFTNTTCPLVQKYLPRLKDLDQRFREQGVQVVAVNVGANDSIMNMAAQAVTYEAEFPFVKDMDGNCVRACGVERTPEVVVIDAQHRLRYRGRIDNQHRLAGTAAAATSNELEAAIESLLADRPVEVAETPVDGCKITPPSPPRRDATYAQVAPLIKTHCQKCHRPGTAAPFSLTTYDDLAANAAMVEEVIAEGRMPPWYGTDEFQAFRNCQTLSAKERDTIVGWLQAGLPRDNADDAAEAATRPAAADDNAAATRAWTIDEPDWVLDVPGTFSIPADGYVDYKYALLPKLVWNETWIEQAEILPSNPRVLHHCNMGSVPLGKGADQASLIAGYVPGSGPLILHDGVAGKIPAKSVIGLQIHFTTTGKPETCRLRIGFRFPRNRVQKQLRYLEISDNHFTIPPFAAAHPVIQSRTLDRNATLTGLFAHMHVRGKDITFRAHAPGREAETLLMVPNYNFNWQMPYVFANESLKYPAGTRFECIAHFDNSTFNAFNPDPAALVRVGQQTTSEMMYGFVFYTDDDEQLDLIVDPKTGRAQ
jgi:mono/diheme cytochrome c family protein/peroxiredoxin